ncbi:hypothetical protein L7F22_060049 [Adiantum nelumboides]|nr:hypothetical protein [Adiantum nelumboides]
MADNNKENRMSIDDFDFAHEDANDDTSMLVNYLVTRLHQAMGNPALQGKVQQQLHAYGILPPIQQERGLERFQGETSKRGLSTEKGVENPYQELKQLLEGKPSSKKKGHAQHERSPSREREESESSDESMEDVAPRRRRAQRSPTPTKRKRSPHSPYHRESKREEKNSKKKKERKRSPSSPSSSPSSSSDEGSGYSSQERQRRGHRRSYAAWKRSSKLKKFKEGGKNISFLTYDGTFGATDKVLAFIKQFDAAFRDEGFTESSKLRHVAMHFQKSARQWWASLRANGEVPKTWKALRASIMKQFLASDAKDKVLTEWRSLKLSPYESIHKYIDKFWDLHLKATVYKKIDFEEQKQQFCAGLPEDMNEYVNSQRPRSISAVIHHTMVAARINFQQGAKRNLKPMEAKEKQEYKGKNYPQNSSKGNSNNNKAKKKGVFKVPKERRERETEAVGRAQISMYGFEALTFNIHGGYLEAIVRGHRGGLLTAVDYNNLCQCETLDDIKMHLSATEYGPYLQNEPSPLRTTTIVEKCTQKLVEEYKHMLTQATEPLSTFLEYITYGHMIDNIVLIVTGTLHERDVHELLEKCHPLGMFESIATLAVAQNMRELYRLVLVDTPLAPYFSECITSEDLDEMNIEIMRNTLYKAYLEDFYKFCKKLGGATSEIMCDLLSFEADRRAVNITINSIGTELTRDDRRKLFSNFGLLYPYGHEELALCEDFDQVRGVMEKYPTYNSIFAKLSYGESQMLDKAFYEEEVKRLCLAFEQQFHYAVFFAYIRLREQEIRNLMWISECVAQNQKSRIHDGIVFIF